MPTRLCGRCRRRWAFRRECGRVSCLLELYRVDKRLKRYHRSNGFLGMSGFFCSCLISYEVRLTVELFAGTYFIRIEEI